ncbi:hypothetical protein TWF970_010536 [Orbilia oligospora]|uniref:BHLH domain-containing protein n=1 Tax=Orbilia oligospora TaxID=2813651 RepID=A0A7C8RG15_ORBOL|nr:hypothetical protein TWF970_010536 [Orbilia oligospora]
MILHSTTHGRRPNSQNLPIDITSSEIGRLTPLVGQRGFTMSSNVNPALWPNGIPDGDEEFADFLDLGDFGINFGQFGMDIDGTQQQQAQQDESQQDQQGQQGGGGNDITMEDFSNMQRNFTATTQPSQHTPHLQVQRQQLTGQNLGLATVFEHQHPQQSLYGRAIIPPTPSSMELHAGAHSMTNFLEQGNIYQNMGADPMVFTPLGTPAVTPLDTSFRVPEYSVSGAYFSPLTSPALDAQALGYMQRKLPKSPVEPAEPSNLNPKKTTVRRKSVTGRAPARVVRQSPSMKPQPGRRKPAPSVPSLELTDAAMAEITSQSPRTPVTRRGGLKIPADYHISSSRDSSSADSISPEPLSESLMPPPPAPSSGHARSPLIPALQNQEANLPNLVQPGPSALSVNHEALPAQKTKGGKPATPASLMNMPKGIAPKGSQELLQATLIPSIPENRPASGATSPLDEQMTPRLSAIQRSSANVTPSSSPMIEPKPAGSDSRPPSGSLKARKDPKGHSKRSSISASPALQPRISPSIKPLLPEGLSASQSALILASKSNYEHIVSGNHSQLGLSYPEHLATNLTHKRTSHKIAEQGRRNRINNALAEIASLLPRKAPEKISDAANNAQPGSKASTVELAIEYIKELKTTLDETTSKLAQVEAELAALKIEKGIPLDQSNASVDKGTIEDKTDTSLADA